MAGSLDGASQGSIERLWLADAAATTALGRRLAQELTGSGAGGNPAQFTDARREAWIAPPAGVGSDQGADPWPGAGDGAGDRAGDRAGAVRASAVQASEAPLASRPPSDPFQPPILLLSGGLGAGKTCLVQGLAAELGISDAITSPTFALAQHYQGQGSAGPTALVHLDLYRLEQAAAADDLFAQEEEEAAALGALLAVEWPERLGLWPQGAWQVELQLHGEGRLALIKRPPMGPPDPSAGAGPQ